MDMLPGCWADAHAEDRGSDGGKRKVSVSGRWCFQPSQPQRITSGLNTNFNLAPSYSLHKLLYHKSFFCFFVLFLFCCLKPQLKFYPQFRNAKPEKQ